jgi:hypothetical protein
MPKKFPLLVVVLSSLAFAQGASEYCASEKAAGESCYKQCCESLGYSWSGGGCQVSDTDQDYVSSSCGYCTDSYVQCVQDYESGQPSGSPVSGGGCCTGIILPALLGISVALPRI